MQVLVTGATGFVGAWTAKALQDAGHGVRLFVRTPAKLEQSAAPIGVDTSDHAVGDITDAGSVATALEGCDVVVHCAAVVATDPKRADEMLETNLAGAHNVIGTAVERGLDPVVHTSSITALFRPGLDVMHADLPVTGGTDAYGRSKAAVDRYVRGLQDAGAPVTVTYPGMVLGPPAGDQFGEAADGVEGVLRIGAVPGVDAAWSVVDVRDLAALHAALLLPGLGPRRFMCGGHHLRVPELCALLSELTGRRLRVVPIPGGVLRGMGKVLDTASRVLPLSSVITEAGMQYYTQMPPVDDQPSIDQLGVAYRSVRETLSATIDGLVANGVISPAQAGRG